MSRGRGQSFRGQFLGEKDPEIKEQLHGGRSGKKQIAQSVRRDGPENHFAFGERFLFGGDAQKNLALTVPLAGSKRGDMSFAEIVAPPRKIDPSRDNAENVIGGKAGAHDGLLIVFDEGAVELELGDELFAHSSEKAIARQAELPGARLWFG